MNWWDDFWSWAENSQLGSNVVGGTIVLLIGAMAALVASVVKTSWREKIWGNVARVFRWVGTIRLTTTERQQAMINEACDSWLELIDDLNGKLTAALAARAKVVAGPPEEPVKPPLPLPSPRWHTYYTNVQGDGFDWGIKNSVGRSVAHEVRLEADDDHFRFFDAAHWEDLSGQSAGTFRGNFTPYARGRGVTSIHLAIEWFDEQGKKRAGEVKLTMARPSGALGDVPF